MKKRILYFILLILVLADTGYSFLQHAGQPLDGDIAESAIPSKEVKPVFNDPLGIKIILTHQSYPNPNRFFCHFAMKEYFDNVPLLLQEFVSPLESAYLSCAIFKTLVQLLLIILIAAVASGSMNLLSLDFMLAAFLVSPLFQTNGYQRYMGIIDVSVSYTFFYAFPAALLLLYFLPFIFQYYHSKKMGLPLLVKILWIPFAFVVCLSGPLNPGIILITSILIFYFKIRRIYFYNYKEGSSGLTFRSQNKIPGNYWFYLLPVMLLSLYSLYIGKYNSNNIHVPLVQMYSRILSGIYYLLTQKLGMPLLILTVIFNILFIKHRLKERGGDKIFTIFRWFMVFVLVYILLLPLGGYRVYRPNILRYDTMLPVTLGFVFMFAYSGLFILKNANTNQRKWYIPVLVIILFIFTLADDPQFHKNACEKKSIMEIASSNDSIIQIPSDCVVLGWGPIKDPENSRLNAQLLVKWKIMDKVKLYYNK